MASCYTNIARIKAADVLITPAVVERELNLKVHALHPLILELMSIWIKAADGTDYTSSSRTWAQSESTCVAPTNTRTNANILQYLCWPAVDMLFRHNSPPLSLYLCAHLSDIILTTSKSFVWSGSSSSRSRRFNPFIHFTSTFILRSFEYVHE